MALATMAGIERALQWQPGSVQDTLDGGEPQPSRPTMEHVEDSSGRAVTITVDIGVPLTAAERREIMAAAEAEILRRFREIRSHET